MTTSGGIGGLPPVGAGVCVPEQEDCAITHSTTGWCLQASGLPVIVITRWPCDEAEPNVTMIDPSTGDVVPNQVVVPCDARDFEINHLCDFDTGTGEVIAAVTQIFEWNEATGALDVRLVAADDPTGPPYVVQGVLRQCHVPTWVDVETSIVCGDTAGVRRQLTQMIVWDTRNGLLLSAFYLDAAGVVTALNMGEAVSVGDCWTPTLPAILDELEEANGSLTDLAACCAAQTLLLTDIDANTDGLEALLTTIRDNADQVESLLTTIRDNADQVEPLLTDIEANTDGLEGLLTSIRDNADQVEALLTAIDANTDGLEACCAATNAELVTLNAAVDQVEALLTTIIGHVDGIEPLITAGNATLVSIAGYLDAVEGQLATIISHVDGIEGLLTTISGQLLTLIGHVDGLEGLVTASNALLTTIAFSIYNEDTAHVSGNPGQFILGVRNDADAVRTTTDGDYSPISVDSAGRVKVVNPDLAAINTNTDGLETLLTDILAALGGTGISVFRDISADATGDVIKGSSGRVMTVHAANLAATDRFIKLYNKATAPTAADTPVMTIALEGPANGNTVTLAFDNGILFNLGIGIRVTTGVSDGSIGSPGANEVILTVGYQ